MVDRNSGGSRIELTLKTKANQKKENPPGGGRHPRRSGRAGGKEAPRPRTRVALSAAEATQPARRPVLAARESFARRIVPRRITLAAV